MSSYDKSFDELLEETLTAWQNQFPGADSSQGSMLFLRSSLLAAARWGIHKHAAWVYDQADPLTAARPSLERWALRRGLPLVPGETDSAILTRILDRERNAPAGGNEADYIRWAREADPTLLGVQMYQGTAAQGLGTVDLVVWRAAPGTILTPEERTLIYDYILASRPVGGYLLRVQAVSPISYAVEMSGVGAGLAATVQAAIIAYMNNLGVGLSPDEPATLYRSQLLSIAVQHGVANPVLTVPATDQVLNFALRELIVVDSGDVGVT